MTEYFSKEEVFKIFCVKSNMQLWRIVNKYNIKTFCEGKGKPNFYLKSSVLQAAKDRGDKVPSSILNKEQNKPTIQSPPQNETSDKPILNEIGKAEYIRIKELIGDRLTELDESWVQVYAISYQQYFLFQYEIAKCGGVDIDPAGNKRPSIYLRMAADCFKQMDRASAVLGIGTINSQKIKMGNEEAKDEMEGLIA